MGVITHDSSVLDFSLFIFVWFHLLALLFSLFDCLPFLCFLLIALLQPPKPKSSPFKTLFNSPSLK